MVIAQVPGEVKAVVTGGPINFSYYGEISQQTVNITSPGTLLYWSYYTEYNIKFWATGPDGQIDNHSGSSYGYFNAKMIDHPGTYTFYWQNLDHSAFSEVECQLFPFIPTGAQLISPQPGIISQNLSMTVIGTNDLSASHVKYSLDNVTYSPVMPGSTAGNWSANINLSNGNNILYVATTYISGTFSYTKYNTFAIRTGFVLDFNPNLELTNPSAGSTITNLTTTVYGTCDANTSAIWVSLDNITFTQATKLSTNWKVNLTLASGANTLYLVADYQRGNFTYAYKDQATINTDTSQINKGNGNSQIDLGLIFLILAIIAIMALVVGFMFIRRRNQAASQIEQKQAPPKQEAKVAMTNTVPSSESVPKLCPTCGSPSTGGDFCGNCGNKLK